MNGNIMRKKIPGWIIDKNKNKINQVRKVIKKTGSSKENNRSSEKIVYQQTEVTKDLHPRWQYSETCRRMEIEEIHRQKS